MRPTHPTPFPAPEAPDDADVIVIGSGMGGAMAARPLVAAGLRVLMLERGDWVPRDPRNWDPDGSFDLTPWPRDDGTFRRAGRRVRPLRTAACVGGQAVFFGGVTLRYRREDFRPCPDLHVPAGARWPWSYGELEPWYGAAEHLLDVAGTTGDDPTAPPRSAPFPQPPAPLSPVARRIGDAAATVGLTPSRLPLAINYRPGPRRCRACGTCDSYACGVGAKNDPAAELLPALLAQGLTLRTGLTALHLETRGRTVTGVICHDARRGRRVVLRARAWVLAAGTLATPHLLLASGLERFNPAGHAVGRYLLRHCNAIVYGIFPRPLEGVEQFHKQLAFFDGYHGDPSGSGPPGRLGVIQQIHPPPPGLLRAMLPFPLDRLGAGAVPRMTGLVVIAEDRPDPANRIVLDHRAVNRLGQPSGVVLHRYGERDLAARAALVRTAKRVLAAAGAVACYVHPIDTFSHAVGTVRMGPDPAGAPLDADGAFRGLDNLVVADGSALPTAAGVNPALTIAATAARAGARLAQTLTGGTTDVARLPLGATTDPARLRSRGAHPRPRAHPAPDAA